jgi:hypothetical protein
MSAAEGLKEAARWHREQTRVLFLKIERAKAWSRENNDGNEDCAGTLFTEEYPLQIKFHENAARTLMRKAAKA